MNTVSIKEERISGAEYIEFLRRTDLGSQYPKERFEQRIAALVEKASISIIARNNENKIVGVCFGLSDFAYWLFITDLGVDRDYVGQGIGKRLMNAIHERAGGEKDIAVYTCVNDKAIPFYEKWGMTKSNDIMEYNRIDWTPFTVGE